MAGGEDYLCEEPSLELRLGMKSSLSRGTFPCKPSLVAVSSLMPVNWKVSLGEANNRLSDMDASKTGERQANWLVRGETS